MSINRHARYVALLVAVVASLATAPAGAQKPSIADIDQLPSASPDGPAFPSYKWARGAPIKPLIVTGGQEGDCVDVTFSKLRGQIRAIREFVPELRNLEDPELIDWPPREAVDAPLLIGLESRTPAIEQAISTYAQIADLRAEPHHLGRSTQVVRSFGEGYGVNDARITYAYAWTEDGIGADAYSEEACRESVWHTTSLRVLLGAGSFLTLLTDRPRHQSVDRRQLMDRLFLRALYACPGSPASDTCLKTTVESLMADPSYDPKGRTMDGHPVTIKN
ncbi:MAG: hypothetical protein KIS73_14755 [Enhydrobacter sp.]|nr:hypothetical protein [Enhydrobacter sp.]